MPITLTNVYLTDCYIGPFIDPNEFLGGPFAFILSGNVAYDLFNNTPHTLTLTGNVAYDFYSPATANLTFTLGA